MIKITANTTSTNDLSRRKFMTGLVVTASASLMVNGCSTMSESEDKKVNQMANTDFAFGIIADAQYADKDPAGNRYYRQSLDKLAACVEDFNRRDLAFVIQLGDIIDGSDDSEKDLDEILKIFNRLKAPKHHVLGNHDFANIDRRTVTAKLNLKKPYYDFQSHDMRFIVLDTMDVAVTGGWDEDSANFMQGQAMLQKLKASGASNAQPWNGGIGTEQKTWLTQVLKDADNKNQKALVFAHMPIMPEGEVHNLWNSEDIIEILNSYDCPIAYINGHRHSGGFTSQGKLSFATIEGMVETVDRTAYAIANVTAGRIEITGTGMAKNRIIPTSNL